MAQPPSAELVDVAALRSLPDQMSEVLRWCLGIPAERRRVMQRHLQG